MIVVVEYTKQKYFPVLVNRDGQKIRHFFSRNEEMALWCQRIKVVRAVYI